MSRFLPWRYVGYWRPTVAQLLDLANRLMAHEAFSDSDGAAIVFGSTAWQAGTVTDRSDVDLAYNVPESDHAYNSFWSGEGIDRVVVRECAEVFGVDKEVALEYKRFLVETLGSQTFSKPDHYAFPSISPSTMDHFQLLATAKGGPWQQFYETIRPVEGYSRKYDVLEYADHITWTLRKKLWPAIQEQRCLDGYDLAGFQCLENLPKQMTRKLLGIMGTLPCPDTWPNLLARLDEINEDWSRELQRLFKPFLAIHGRYTVLVDRLFAGTLTMTEDDYNRLILHTLASLPYEELFVLIAARVFGGSDYGAQMNRDEMTHDCKRHVFQPELPAVLSPNLFEPLFDP